jgi:hypothetical protein
MADGPDTLRPIAEAITSPEMRLLREIAAQYEELADRLDESNRLLGLILRSARGAGMICLGCGAGSET